MNANDAAILEEYDSGIIRQRNRWMARWEADMIMRGYLAIEPYSKTMVYPRVTAEGREAMRRAGIVL